MVFNPIKNQCDEPDNVPNCSKEKSVLIKKNGVVYPPNEQYAPCECLENSLSPATIGLNCADRKANDSRISDVLDYFLAIPDISPLGQLRLNNGLVNQVNSPEYLVKSNSSPNSTTFHSQSIRSHQLNQAHLILPPLYSFWICNVTK